MVDLGITSVLVADDEPSTRAMVASHLRSIGYKVVEAVDGDEAFSLALEHLPDLVVLDVMMPGMSGWEVCRRIRETVSLAHTGVVMLTGIGESLNEITSPLYGADAYLDKPFEFSVLDRTIAETMEARRGHIGRPDGADVEIVQTMGSSDESGETASAKPKRTRKRAASNAEGDSAASKPQKKRSSRRGANETNSQSDGVASEGNALEVSPKPEKKKARKAAKAVESADAAPKAKPLAKAKAAAEDAAPKAPATKKKAGKKAKAKAPPKKAAKAKKGGKAAAPKAKKAAPKAKKVSKSKASATRKGAGVKRAAKRKKAAAKPTVAKAKPTASRAKPAIAKAKPTASKAKPGVAKAKPAAAKKVAKPGKPAKAKKKAKRK